MRRGQQERPEEASAALRRWQHDDSVQPKQPWLIATGNVDNRTLEALVRHAMPQVERAFEGGGFVELG